MARKGPIKHRSEIPMEDMTVTTIAFPHAMHEALKRAALEHGAAVAQIVREAVTNWLQADKEDGIAKQRTGATPSRGDRR